MCPLRMILFVWLHFLSAAAMTTRLTNLTFVPQKLSWNDAREACYHMGGHLVEILDETKNNVVYHVIEEYTQRIPNFINVGIGLATLDPHGLDFYWAESCIPLTLNSWTPAKLDVPNVMKQCVKIQRETGTWVPAKCGYGRYYMCEHTSDEKCPYRSQDNTRLLEDGVSLTFDLHRLNLADCLRLCDEVTNGDEECWAVNFRSSGDTCLVFFTTDPYLIRNSTNQRYHPEWTLFSKQCYNAILGSMYNMTTIPNTSESPQFNCTGTGMTSSATADLQTYTEQTTVFTESPAYSQTPVIPSEKSDSNPSWNTAVSFTEITSTGEQTTLRNWSSDSVTLTSTAPETSTLPEQSTDNSDRTPNQETACTCPCQRQPVYPNKQKFMEEMLVNLTIDKTKLSSVRRKYYCAVDNRPMAVGIGRIGAVCIAVTLGLILFCDATTFLSNMSTSVVPV